jgi:hypothetical protein
MTNGRYRDGDLHHSVYTQSQCITLCIRSDKPWKPNLIHALMLNCRFFNQWTPSGNGSIVASPVSPHSHLGTARFAFLLCGFVFDRLRLDSTPHLHQGIDQIIDGFVFLSLTPHPHQRVEKVINGFLFFCHAIFYVWPGCSCIRYSPGVSESGK